MVKRARKATRDGNTWGLKGTLHGLAFESGFERKFIRICRQLGIKLERSKAVVAYVESGKRRTYHPDFYWPEVDFTVEIKGAWAFKENHGFVREKYEASVKFFGGRYTILTEKELTGDFVIRMYREQLERVRAEKLRVP